MSSAELNGLINQLKSEFPRVDNDIVESVAYAVNLGRYTMEVARSSLREMSVLEDLYGAVEEAEKSPSSSIRQDPPQSQPQQQQQYQKAADPVPAPAPQAPTMGSSAALRSNEVIYYTTSITASRQVRDHCRQLRNALYILRIAHHEMDVSDNVFMRRKLISLCGGRDFGLPLLFVGENPIGGFTEADQLIEDNALLPALEGLGYEHDPAKFEEQHLIQDNGEDDDDDDGFESAQEEN